MFATSFNQMVAAMRRFSRGELYFDVTVHTHVGGRPLGALYFAEVLSSIKALAAEAWIATRDEAADRVLRASQ